MNLKEMFRKMMSAYFILVTCILVAIMVTGMIFEPDAKFGYGSLAAPLIYAFFGMIPAAVMYSPGELSDKQLIIRKIIQLAITEAEIMAFFIFNPAIDTSEPRKIIGLMAGIFVVYIITNLINFANSCLNAQKMNRNLLDFQKNAQ